MAQEPWPVELDAVRAAPEHHVVLFENERVRVLDTRIAPGERTRLHTHRWPAVLHVLGVSEFVRRDERGEVAVDSRTLAPGLTVGQALWQPPLGPHTLENVGTTVIHVVSVELKSAGE